MHICAIRHAHALYLLCLMSSVREFCYLAQTYGWAVQGAMVAEHPMRFGFTGKSMSKMNVKVVQSLIVSCDEHGHAQYLAKQAGSKSPKWHRTEHSHPMQYHVGKP